MMKEFSFLRIIVTVVIATLSALAALIFYGFSSLATDEVNKLEIRSQGGNYVVTVLNRSGGVTSDVTSVTIEKRLLFWVRDEKRVFSCSSKGSLEKTQVIIDGATIYLQVDKKCHDNKGASASLGLDEYGGFSFKLKTY